MVSPDIVRKFQSGSQSESIQTISQRPISDVWIMEQEIAKIAQYLLALEN